MKYTLVSPRTVIASAIAVCSVLAIVGKSQVNSFEVLERKSNGRIEIRTVRIEEMADPSRFETPDFKIVLKKSNEALHVSELTPEMRLKAATVLHHLQKAKKYFLEKLGSENARTMEQVIVRLEITNRYSNLGHFAHDNYDPQYNNVFTVRGGEGRETRDGPLVKWGREIWFRPRKDIPMSELRGAVDPYDPVIKQVNAALLPNQVDIAIRNFVSYAFSERGLGDAYVQSITRQAGTLAVIEVALQVMKFLNRMVSPSTYYLDTAMVPEIIYHEFGHLALSDRLFPTHPVAVNEGLADFFAADISGNPNLATKIKRYSTSQGKKGKKLKDYKIEFESSDQATGDFVLSFLWSLRDVLGEEDARQVIFAASEHLDIKTANIRYKLTEALVRACDVKCTRPDSRLRLLQHLSAVGL